MAQSSIFLEENFDYEENGFNTSMKSFITEIFTPCLTPVLSQSNQDYFGSSDQTNESDQDSNESVPDKLNVKKLIQLYEKMSTENSSTINSKGAIPKKKKIVKKQNHKIPLKNPEIDLIYKINILTRKLKFYENQEASHEKYVKDLMTLNRNKEEQLNKKFAESIAEIENGYGKSVTELQSTLLMRRTENSQIFSQMSKTEITDKINNALSDKLNESGKIKLNEVLDELIPEIHKLSSKNNEGVNGNKFRAFISFFSKFRKIRKFFRF